MARALEVAASTPPGDVPVGAVVFGPDAVSYPHLDMYKRTVLRSLPNPTAHAEILALRAAAAVHGDSWRLTGCTLVVTLEPCAMCAGALVGARTGAVVFGAWEPRTGACGSVFDVARESPLHRVEVRGGVLDDECGRLLRTFFSLRRSDG
nr:nucleoside deaminase [Corynebacterium provencense]